MTCNSIYRAQVFVHRLVVILFIKDELQLGKQASIFPYEVSFVLANQHSHVQHRESLLLYKLHWFQILSGDLRGKLDIHSKNRISIIYSVPSAMLCTGDMKTYYLNISLPGNQTLGSQRINISSAQWNQKGIRKELMSSDWSLKERWERR